MVKADSYVLRFMFPNIKFGPNGDCTLIDEGAGSFIYQWLLGVPQPTQAEVDAAIPQANAAQVLADTNKAQDAASLGQTKAAYASLQTLIDGIDTATLAQAKAAIKLIAQINQHLIRATVGR